MKKTAIILLSIRFLLRRSCLCRRPDRVACLNGEGSFPHRKHQEMLKDCKKCHEKGPGTIKDSAKIGTQDLYGLPH